VWGRREILTGLRWGNLKEILLGRLGVVEYNVKMSLQ
jgi:hypothetical protein